MQIKDEGGFNMKTYLAIDIGASSGRHIIGWAENGKIMTEELYRFPNGVTELDGHLTWDIDALLGHVKRGIEIAKEKHPDIESLSIDTWGVDYVLMRGARRSAPAMPTATAAPKRSSRRCMRRSPFRNSIGTRASSSSPSTPSISSVRTKRPGGSRASQIF